MKFIILLALTMSFAAQAKELRSPKTLYTSMTKAFPTAMETLGGFSMAITMDDLSCAKSKTATGLKYECSGFAFDGSPLMAAGSKARELHQALVKAGAKLDTSSEPGTVYAGLATVDCSKIECKPSSPSDCRNAKITYSCDGE